MKHGLPTLSLVFALMAAPSALAVSPLGAYNPQDGIHTIKPEDVPPSLESQIDKNLNEAEQQLREGLALSAMRNVLYANGYIEQLDDVAVAQSRGPRLLELLEKSVEALESKVQYYLNEGSGYLALDSIALLQQSMAIKNFVKDSDRLNTLIPQAHGATAVEVVNIIKRQIDSIQATPLGVTQPTYKTLTGWVAQVESHLRKAGGYEKVPNIDRSTLDILFFKYDQAYTGVMYQDVQKALKAGDLALAQQEYNYMADHIAKFSPGRYRSLGFLDRDIADLNQHMKRAIKGFSPSLQVVTAPKPRRHPR